MAPLALGSQALAEANQHDSVAWEIMQIFGPANRRRGYPVAVVFDGRA